MGPFLNLLVLSIFLLLAFSSSSVLVSRGPADQNSFLFQSISFHDQQTNDVAPHLIGKNQNDDDRVHILSPTIGTCPRRDTKHDILEIKTIAVIPDPPTKGSQFQIIANGVLKSTLEKGATVDVVIKLGRFIQILKMRWDLCEQMEKVGKFCPVAPGPVEFQGTFDLPKEIPNGHYFVEADAINANGDHITCLLAELRFTRQTL